MRCHPGDKVEISRVPVITPTPIHPSNRNTATLLCGINRYGGSTFPDELLHKELCYYSITDKYLCTI